VTPRVDPDEFVSDAVERMSGARLRTAPRILSVEAQKPSLLVIGNDALRPLLDRFDPNQVDLRWVREPVIHGTVFDDAEFDMALIHANAFEQDANDVWSTLLSYARCRQVVIVGKVTNLPSAFTQARAPLILSSHVPLTQHYASIHALLEAMCGRTLATETAHVPSENPQARDPSRAVVARLTKELANLSMSAQPALVALEELAQKDGVTLEHTTVLANSWKRIDDCLRDVTTLLDAPTESQAIHTLRVLERFVDDYIEHIVPTQRFISRLAQSLWPIRVTEAEFRLLCELLLANARHATRRGGEILLEADNATLLHSSPELPDLEPSDYVRVRVCDNGVGMTQVTQRRAKEPFYSTLSTDSNWKGLGLAQADAICRRSFGSLTLQTQEGKGTIVTAWLRRCEFTAA
jgi:signal transduction histidine kinase